jgi:hypothetical protein
MVNATVRTQVFFSNSIFSVQSIDYAFDNPSNILSRDEKGTRCITTPDSLTEKERELYKEFCEAMGVSPNNYGTVFYDANNAFTFFSYPMMGIKDGKPTLMIGATVGKEYHAGFVPLVREGETYKLNGLKAVLIGVKTETKTIPYVAVKTKNYVFHIGLKIDKETEFDHIDHAWDNGELELYLNPLSKTAVKFSNMFKLLFDSNAFPSTGVLLVLNRGKVKQPPEGKNWEPNSQWSIEAYPQQLADLPVLDLDGNITELRNCGIIFVPAGSTLTKMLVSSEAVIERVYVYVTGKHSSGNTHWMPAHTATQKPERLPINVQNTFQSLIKSLLMPKNNGNTPASNQTIPIESTPVVESHDPVVQSNNPVVQSDNPVVQSDNPVVQSDNPATVDSGVIPVTPKNKGKKTVENPELPF